MAKAGQIRAIHRKTHSQLTLDTAVRDLTVVDQHAAGAGGSQPTEPVARGTSTGQVVVGNIPRQPPGFQPLPGLLADLDRDDAGVLVVYAVTRMLGVGKTQLAAAFAREKMAEGWRIVAWVNAGDAGSLLADLAAIVDAAGWSDGGGQDPGQVVRHRLEDAGERCLLVLDDVEDPDLVRPLVPIGGTAKVLITTIRESVANLGTSVPMGALNADEAAKFLDERTGLDDEAGAAALAARLGYLPLPLAQAAAVIAEQQLGYDTYLDRLRALPVEAYLTRESEQTYPPGLPETVLLSLDAVRAADQTGACAGLMEIMAVLSAAGVNRELLHAAGQVGALTSGHRVTPATVDRALEQLAERSLLTVRIDGQAIIVHRLVALVVREGLIRRGRLTAAGWAAASVLEARAEALAESQDRPAARDITRQVMALLESVGDTAAKANLALDRVLLRLRLLALHHLIELGDSPPQAIAFGESLAADLEHMLGRDHPDTLASRISLAAAYQTVGRVDEAVPLLEKALADQERVLSRDHPDTFRSRSALASAYRKTGQVAKAIPLAEQILATRERLLGADHPSTLASRNNLAAAYREAGRATEAIPLLEQTLVACERLLGADDPRTLATRNNLALAYQEAGPGALVQVFTLEEPHAFGPCADPAGRSHVCPLRPQGTGSTTRLPSRNPGPVRCGRR